MTLTPERLEEIFRESPDYYGSWVNLDPAEVEDPYIGLDGSWRVGPLIEALTKAVLE
jgi:hypothetical protein